MPSGTDVVSHTVMASHSSLQHLPGRFALAPVGDVVLQPVVVLIVRLPDERLQPLLVVPAPSEGVGGGGMAEEEELGWFC